MALGELYEDDYLSWEFREDVTLKVLQNPSEDTEDTYTDHELTAPDGEGAAKRRALTYSEVMLSNGRYTSANIMFLVPLAVLPTGVEPRPMFQIVAEDGTYSIVDIHRVKYGQTFQCVCVRI